MNALNKSGLFRAFPITFFFAKFTIFFSVPILITEKIFFTINPPVRNEGSGTSITFVSPFDTSKTICFIFHP